MTKRIVVEVEQIRDLPIGRLVVSPEEARKTIDQAGLDELAKSIDTSGIIEALLVRPVGADYEIVSGQRRWLASKLMGRPTCPCVVRDLSDDEARELRIISNLQREDLAPIEEAEAYGKLLDRPGSTIETVAAALAKSASYVGRRVQLLKAIEPVRAALKAGAIEAGHALELARLSDDQQKNILNQMEIGWHEDDSEDDGEMGVCKFCGCDEMHACHLETGPCSWTDDDETVCSNPECVAKAKSGETALRPTTWTVADLKHHVRRNACRNLGAAPFPLNDGGLGEIACTNCPKRTMNSALLFDDLGGADTCTDAACFGRKSQAFVELEIKVAATAKRPLLKISDTYTSEKGVLREYDVAVIGKDGVKPCDHAETAIWVTGRDLAKTVEICRKGDCKVHGAKGYSSSSSSSGSKPSGDVSAERKKILEKVKAKKAYRVALMAALAKAPISSAALERDLNLEVCLQLIHHANSQQVGKVALALGWPDKLFHWDGKKALREKLVAIEPSERLRVALLAEHCGEMGVQEYNLDAKPEDLERLAKLVGVDAAKLAAAAKGEPAVKLPAPVKSVPNKPVKAKKPLLSAVARKRIAEAQKKRWKQSAKKGGRR